MSLELDGHTNDRALADVAPLAGFAAAAEVALHLLHDTVGLDLWLVTQRKGEEQVAIAVCGDWLAVPTGSVFPWVESFCRHMVAGTAPRIAPRCADIPAYAEAATYRDVTIGTYVGAPIVDWEGRLFGTICGVAADAKDETLHRHRRLLDTTAQLLSTLLAKEQLAADRSEAAAAAYALSDRDPLTGLLNSRGWDYALSVEQQRQSRDGGAATLLAITAGAGEPESGQKLGSRPLQAAADVLTGVCRPYDRLARLDDTLAVLAVDCDTAGGTQLADRLQAALQLAGLTCSVRYLRCAQGTDLRAGWALCQNSPTTVRRPLALQVRTGSDGEVTEAAEMIRLRAQALRILHLSGLSRAELLTLRLSDLDLQPDGGLLVAREPGAADTERDGVLIAKPENVDRLIRYRDALARRLASQSRHPSAPPSRGWPLFPVFAPSGYVTPVRLSDRGLARVLYAGSPRGRPVHDDRADPHPALRPRPGSHH
ncbi:MAG: diguanylate cyclase [Frankiaceae bacterium]